MYQYMNSKNKISFNLDYIQMINDRKDNKLTITHLVLYEILKNYTNNKTIIKLGLLSYILGKSKQATANLIGDINRANIFCMYICKYKINNFMFYSASHIKNGINGLEYYVSLNKEDGTLFLEKIDEIQKKFINFVDEDYIGC